jgi:hypothetical protein
MAIHIKRYRLHNVSKMKTSPDGAMSIGLMRWNSKAESATKLARGHATQDDESTIIWINWDYDLLTKALASSTLTPHQIDVRADRYQFPVASGLWLQRH